MKQKLLLIGSSGFLGRVLYQQLSEYFTVIPTHTTNKVFETSKPYDFFSDDVQVLLDEYSPDIVVMAAAVELDEIANYQSKVQQFVTACKSRYLVYISSDALFDGTKGSYTETDPPSPITPYGRNLVYFEEEIQAQCNNHLMIRPSYLYGYSIGVLDSRLAKTKTLLEAGETVSCFEDMYKSPLEVDKAANAMTQLVSQKYQDILHVAGERKSVYDFQHEAMRTLGINTANLKPSKMPMSSGFLKDTSLDISRITEITGKSALNF